MEGESVDSELRKSDAVLEEEVILEEADEDDDGNYEGAENKWDLFKRRHPERILKKQSPFILAGMVLIIVSILLLPSVGITLAGNLMAAIFGYGLLSIGIPLVVVPTGFALYKMYKLFDPYFTDNDNPSVVLVLVRKGEGTDVVVSEGRNTVQFSSKGAHVQSPLTKKSNGGNTGDIVLDLTGWPLQAASASVATSSALESSSSGTALALVTDSSSRLEEPSGVVGSVRDDDDGDQTEDEEVDGWRSKVLEQ